MKRTLPSVHTVLLDLQDLGFQLATPMHYVCHWGPNLRAFWPHLSVLAPPPVPSVLLLVEPLVLRAFRQKVPGSSPTCATSCPTFFRVFSFRVTNTIDYFCRPGPQTVNVRC